MKTLSKDRYSRRYTYPIPDDIGRLYGKDISYFNISKEVSKMSSYRKAHVGCIAVLNHRIISSGTNNYKSEPIQQELNKIRFIDDNRALCIHSAHAEVRCLKPLLSENIRMRNIKLYVYRELKSGIPALARPCASCMKLIRDCGIRYIYYTGDNEYYREDMESGLITKLI